MQLRYDELEDRFREEVRDFLTEKLAPDLRSYTAKMTSVYASKEVALAWQAILVKKGWAAPSWPVEYGGCDWSIAQHYIFDVELARAGAPPLSPMGIGMCGPALIGYGSDQQKDYFLPRILSGADFWSQGYSEPHAGSDLAALSMSAVEDDDDFVCNGSKIWTTHAHESNMMFCLVRTSSDGKPQQGITFLLIDMTLPGVRVDPIIMTSGEHIQNAVFFDDVRVSKSNVIGEVDKGWTVAKYLLEFERGGSSYGPKLAQRLKALRRLAFEAGAMNPSLQSRLSAADIDISVLEAAELVMMAELAGGGSPGLKASMMKVRGTELSQYLTELGLEIAGHYVQPFQPQHTHPGGAIPNAPASDQALVGQEGLAPISSRYFNDRAGSIYAGSNEIQRNILAKAALRL